MARGLLNALILGAGLTAGAIGIIYLARQFNVSPVRQTGGGFGYDYTPSILSSDVMSEKMGNTLPPITPGMLPETVDWIARRNRGAQWYS